MNMRVCVLTVMVAVGSLFAFGKGEVKRPDSYAYNRGVECFQNEEWDDAINWFGQEIAANPKNGYAYSYLGAVLASKGNYGQALTAFDKAMKLVPKKDNDWRSNDLRMRSKVYMALVDTVRALDDLGAAIKLMPEKADSYEERAEIHYLQRNYELSDADYLKLMELQPGSWTAVMGLGRNAKFQERWDEAIDWFNKGIALDSSNSRGYSFRAEAYLGQEKWNEAASDIIKALDLDGDDKAFFLMSSIAKEGYPVMKAKLKVQMTKEPDNRYWPYCLGSLAQQHEDYEEAISYYEKSNEIDSHPQLLSSIAECYYSMDNFPAALEYIDRALAMNPDDDDLYNNRASVLGDMGRFDEAIAEWTRYIAANPEYAGGYLMRADDKMKSERFKEAAEDYEIGEVLLPFGFTSYFYMKRGDAYRLSGNPEKARKDYERMLEIESDSELDANSNAPFAYSCLGQPEKAITTMKAIVALDTLDRPGALYNLACIHARVDMPEEALATLREAVEAGYHNVLHMQSDYDLKALRDMPEFKEIVESAKSNRPAPAVGEGKKEETDSVNWREETVEVPFTKEGGVTKVKCDINGLPLHFVFDTGAADVTISQVEANFMLKNDYIKSSDVVGSQYYMDANGDISEGTVVNLRKVNFGGLELDNVRASVVRNQRAPLLLGQSVLGRLGKIQIDNPAQKLIITHKVKEY